MGQIQLPAREMTPDATTSSGMPIDNNGSQFTLDGFPYLKEIVMYTRTPDTSIGGDMRASAPESSGPFPVAVTAWQQAGRLARVL